MNTLIFLALLGQVEHPPAVQSDYPPAIRGDNFTNIAHAYQPPKAAPSPSPTLNSAKPAATPGNAAEETRPVETRSTPTPSGATQDTSTHGSAVAPPPEGVSSRASSGVIIHGHSGALKIAQTAPKDEPKAEPPVVPDDTPAKPLLPPKPITAAPCPCTDPACTCPVHARPMGLVSGVVPPKSEPAARTMPKPYEPIADDRRWYRLQAPHERYKGFGRYNAAGFLEVEAHYEIGVGPVVKGPAPDPVALSAPVYALPPQLVSSPYNIAPAYGAACGTGQCGAAQTQAVPMQRQRGFFLFRGR